MEFSAEGENVYQTSAAQTIYIVRSSEELDHIQKRLPSLIAMVISALEKQTIAGPSQSQLLPYDIDAKISHNQVIKYEGLIKNYGNYLYIIEKIYDGMEAERPGSKAKFLGHVNRKYISICGSLSLKHKNRNKYELICENADNIIDTIIDELRVEYFNSRNVSSNIWAEELQECLEIIVCNAFIDCKILENPSA